MITYHIEKPLRIDASIKLPASKSISNRALIIQALMNGGVSLENISNCDDTDVILRAMKDMPEVIDIKAAGTAMRFMTAFLSCTENGTHVLTGTNRMRHRPIKPLVDALLRLGADITYTGQEGYPPLLIKGQALSGGYVEVPGNVSSQYISALLLVAPMLRGGMELHLLGDITSRPYIDLTLCMMREFGADADWTSGNTVVVRPKPYEQRPYLIENDWSSASYWYEMMALTADADAEIVMPGLTDGSRQGDAAVRYIFSMLGVKTVFKNRVTTDESGARREKKVVVLRKNNRSVPRLDYDFVNSPDLVQTIVVTCVAKDIPFHFRGLQTLKIKETDRIKALMQELRKVGVVIRVENGSDLVWDGERCEATFEPIDTYEDHRMAMAFAAASIRFPGLMINNPEVVTKSYPDFWEHLKQAGFTIEEIDN